MEKNFEFKTYTNNFLVFGNVVIVNKEKGLVELYILASTNPMNIIVNNMEIILKYAQTLDIHKELLSTCKLIKLRMVFDNEITYQKIKKDLTGIIDNSVDYFHYLVAFDIHLSKITGDNNHISVHRIKKNDWETFYKTYQEIIS
jgi:hypothetical protein